MIGLIDCYSFSFMRQFERAWLRESIVLTDRPNKLSVNEFRQPFGPDDFHYFPRHRMQLPVPHREFCIYLMFCNKTKNKDNKDKCMICP